MPPLFPMQGRMGQQMMGSLFGGGRSPLMGMNRTPQFPMMGRPPQMNGGGGLLSRLFSRGASAGGMNPSGGMNGLMGMQQAGRALGGSGALTNSGAGGGLSSFLNNTQQVIKTAQSIGPMVQQFQQYGSLIRNIPAMWRLFQGLKNSSVDSAEDSADTTESDSKTSSNKESNHKSESSSNKDGESSSNKPKKAASSAKKQKQAEGTTKQIKKAKGASVPKLYI